MKGEWSDNDQRVDGDRLISQWHAHMLAIYQVYYAGVRGFDACMWDGTSLINAVLIKSNARTVNAAKRACEQHFATGEAEQRLQKACQA